MATRRAAWQRCMVASDFAAGPRCPVARGPSVVSARPRLKANRNAQVLGLFVFYVGHDALQEHNFRREGFEFGWFTAAREIVARRGGAAAAAWIVLLDESRRRRACRVDSASRRVAAAPRLPRG